MSGENWNNDPEDKKNDIEEGKPAAEGESAGPKEKTFGERLYEETLRKKRAAQEEQDSSEQDTVEMQISERVQEISRALFDVETNRQLAELRLQLLQNEGDSAASSEEPPPNLTESQAALWRIQNDLQGVIKRAKARKGDLLTELLQHYEHIRARDPNFNLMEHFADLPDDELRRQLLKDIQDLGGQSILKKEEKQSRALQAHKEERDITDWVGFPEEKQTSEPRQERVSSPLAETGPTRYRDRVAGMVNQEELHTPKWLRRMPYRLAARKRDLEQKIADVGLGNIGPRIWSRSWMLTMDALKGASGAKEKLPGKISQRLNIATVLGVAALALLASKSLRDLSSFLPTPQDLPVDIDSVPTQEAVKPPTRSQIETPKTFPDSPTLEQSQPDTRGEQIVPAVKNAPKTQFEPIVYSPTNPNKIIGDNGFNAILQLIPDLQVTDLHGAKKAAAFEQLAGVLERYFTDPQHSKEWQDFYQGVNEHGREVASRAGLFQVGGKINPNMLRVPEVANAIQRMIEEGGVHGGPTQLLANHMPPGGFTELMETSLKR